MLSAPVDFQYSLNGKLFSQFPATTYLGLHITDNLSWNEHCDNICKKANSTLGLLGRILSGCSPGVKSNAYLTPVGPKLEYASTVGNPYTQCNIDKIKMVQRRATRFVFNDYSRFRQASPMIDALGWIPLEHHRDLSTKCVCFIRSVKGMLLSLYQLRYYEI